MKKRYLLFTAMLLMVSILFAGTAQALTVTELLQSAEEKMAAATGYEMKSTVDLVMRSGDEQANVEMIIKAKYRFDPLCIKMQTIVEMEGENGKADIYMQIEDDELAMYVSENKEVYKTTLPMSDDALAQLTGAVSPEDYLKAYKKVKYAGTDKVNGKNVYVVTALLDAMALEDQISGELTGLGLADARFNNSILSSMQDVPVKLYIQQNTHYIVRTEIDMTNLMNEIFKKVGSELSDVKVDQYSMVMDYSNINKVKPFSIPSSIIKKAQSQY